MQGLPSALGGTARSIPGERLQHGCADPVSRSERLRREQAAVKLFSEGLIAELRGSTIRPTVVFQGAVGTNMPVNSGVDIPSPTGASGRQPKTTAPEDAGRQIADVIEKGIQRWRIGGDARMMDRFSRVMPLRSIGLIADRMKKMLAS